MRKTVIVLISFLWIFLIVGCSNEKDNTNKKDDKQEIIHCTINLDKDDTKANYTIESTYDIYGTDNIVHKIISHEKVMSDDPKTLSYFEDYLNYTYESFNDKYSGYSYNIKIKDKQVISDVTIDYNSMNMDSYVIDNPEMLTYVNDEKKLTMESAKKIYESMNGICK